MQIGGNSEQESREGYNLVDYIDKIISSTNGIASTVDPLTGYVTSSGTLTQNYTPITKVTNIDDKLIVGKTYTLWQENTDLNHRKIYLQINEKDPQGNYTYYATYSEGVRRFTVKEGYTYSTAIQTGTVEQVGTITNYKNRYMIYEGTEDKEFELYGAMPSPEYPSKIRNVGDNVNILFPFTSEYYKRNDESIDISTVVTDNNDGTYTFVGGGGATQRIKCTQKIKAKENESFAFNFKKVSGDNFRLVIKLYKNDDTIINSGLSGFTWNNTYQGYYKDNPFDTTFICPAQTTYIKYELLTPTTATVSDIKLERGKIATPYTPYGYGSADIKVENKNILNIKEGLEETINGVTISIKNGVVTLNGTATAAFAFKGIGTLNYYKDKKYSIIYDYISGNCTDYGAGLYIGSSITSTNAISGYAFRSTQGRKEKITITETKNGRLYTYITGNANTTYNNYKIRFQIEEGEEATDYVPHEEQTLHFPLAKVLHKGDYLADDGIHHKRKTIVLDGTESWSNSVKEGNYQWFSRTGLSGIKVSEFICSHLKNYEIAGEYAGISSRRTPDRIYLCISESIDTRDKLKAYLAEQYANGTPVVVEYELAEEEIEAYTAEQQEAYNKLKELYSYEDMTHITCENDITCNFNVEHFKDYNILRQNDKQELQAQIDEIKAILTSEVSE